MSRPQTGITALVCPVRSVWSIQLTLKRQIRKVVQDGCTDHYDDEFKHANVVYEQIARFGRMLPAITKYRLGSTPGMI